jgi:hypothetical protein
MSVQHDGRRRLKDTHSIEHQVPHATAPIIPGVDSGKGVVESDNEVGVSEVAPAVHVELANLVHADRRTHRLVQEFNGRDSRMAAHIVADLVECLDGSADRVALTPTDTTSLTRVVEAVLGVGGCAGVRVVHMYEKQATHHREDQS